MSVDTNLFCIPVSLIKREDINVSSPRNYRSDFMRDRDRILYSRAFRRLAGKTQIYTTGIDDHQRNRLTHTLEVAQIARTIASALGLNCDLAEAISLGHDLGHAPFGHAGEEILQQLMTHNDKEKIDNSPFNTFDEQLQDMCGFKHNIQSVRVAARIEDNYGQFGLNLTNYTLWGILNHAELSYSSSFSGEKNVAYLNDLQHLVLTSEGTEAWSFEGMIVKYADIIAQWHHDLEDALLGFALTTEEVNESLSTFLADMTGRDKASITTQLPKSIIPDREYSTKISAIVIDCLVSALVDSSKKNLKQIEEWMKKKYAQPVKFFMSTFSTLMINNININKAIGFEEYDYLNQKSEAEQTEIYRRNEIINTAIDSFYKIISERIHHSMDVERMNTKGQYIIRKIFEAYYAHPQQLPDGAIIHYMIDAGTLLDDPLGKKYETVEDAYKSVGTVRTDFEKLRKDESSFDLRHQALLMRRICDHISGMTDRYAIYEYNNLY